MGKISMMLLIVLLLPVFSLTTHAAYSSDRLNFQIGGLPAPTTIVGGGGGGGGGTSGTEYNEGLILQFTRLLSNYTLDLIRLFTKQSQLEGVLEYRINTPTTAIQGETIQITNLFTNDD